MRGWTVGGARTPYGGYSSKNSICSVDLLGQHIVAVATVRKGRVAAFIRVQVNVLVEYSSRSKSEYGARYPSRFIV